MDTPAISHIPSSVSKQLKTPLFLRPCDLSVGLATMTEHSCTEVSLDGEEDAIAAIKISTDTSHLYVAREADTRLESQAPRLFFPGPI